MTVKVGEMTLYGVMPEGTNPLPRFRRQRGFGTFVPVGEFPPEMAENLGSATLTLPYKMQDRYTRKRQKLTLKTAVLENKYLRYIISG